VRLSAQALIEPPVVVVAAVAIVAARAAPTTKPIITLRFFMSDILPMIAEICLLILEKIIRLQ
jgi:hypothetical protein